MSEKAKKTEEDFSFKCPLCENGLIKISKTIYELQDGDNLLILKFECNECKFSKNDVIPLSTNMKPGIFTLKVQNEGDLKSKIYRSPTGKLEIPELELIVDPGPRADFYYTNVEGILFRFENAVRIYRNTLDENDPQISEVNDILRDLEKALRGEFQFTLKITDLSGGSYIITENNDNLSFEPMDYEDPNKMFDLESP